MNLIYYSVMILLALQCNVNGEDMFDCSSSVSDSDEDSSDESSNSSDASGCTKLLKRSERSTENQESSLVEFTCELEGRFSDLTDSTCMRYFQCDELSNGTFSKKTLKCPNSTFCSETQKCSSVHPCPCHTTERSSVQTTTESIQTTGLDFCSTSEVFDFNCDTEGRFPDYNDRGCQKYFLCSKLHNGTLMKTEYKCLNSYFDPMISKCSSVYPCPCHTTERSSVQTTTESIQTTGLDFCSTSEVFDFNCDTEGRFPDYNDRGCQKYFLCSKLHNGTLMKTEYKCLNSYFDPMIAKCSIRYSCPCKVTPITSSPTSTFTTVTTSEQTTSFSPSESITEAITSSESTTPIPLMTTSETTTLSGLGTTVGCTISTNEFECFAAGRFPDLSDATCRSYFLCSKLSNGTYIKTVYMCLKSTFNPLILKCSTNYVCPCQILPTTNPTTSSSASTFSEGFTEISTTTMTTTTTVSTTTTSYACVDKPENVPEFKCESVGRFPDYHDVTCRKYFLCSILHNGTYVRTPYSCPVTSCINPDTQKCSSKYVCPCA